MEYARHACGIADAGHAEYDTGAPALLIAPVACPVPERPEGAPKLSGRLVVRLESGSLARRIYGRTPVDEEFACNYELNPAFRERIEADGLRFTGSGDRGEARVAELPGHPFFLATLFLPQLSSTPECPHPVAIAFLRALGSEALHRRAEG